MKYQELTRIIISNDTSIEHKKVPIVGRLSLKKGDGDFLKVEIPQEFSDSVFEAIKEEGMQKPEYRAHVSVMNSDELDGIEVEEVGEDIILNLGSVMSVDPEGWDEMDQVWFVECDAPRLKEIRQKYGLTPLLNGDHEFHITIAVKPKKEKEMKFSSKKKAIQYLADFSKKRIIISANEDEIQNKLISFLIENPNPNDESFHDFAEELGTDIHELESQAYKLSTKLAIFLKNGRASEKNITREDVDPKELQMGIEIEKEHTPDASIAERIALDHLAEEGLSDYYTLLKKMEEDAKARK